MGTKLLSEIAVTQWVRVTVDESKFTEQFMQEFRDSFYSFRSIDDHVTYLAKLYARGAVDEFTKFIEGYGPPADFGIEFELVDVETSAVYPQT